MGNKSKKLIMMLIIIGILIILVCFNVYKKNMEYKLETEDADYVLTSKVKEDNTFDLYLKRSKHSGDFKSVNFMLVLNNDTELFNINKDNYTKVEHEFSDNSILTISDSKNNETSLTMNYKIPDIINNNIPYGFFHIVIKGNNNKYQYFTVVYYLNNQMIETQILEADDVYDHPLINNLANKISNYNDIDLTLETLSNLLVNEREQLKTKINN